MFNPHVQALFGDPSSHSITQEVESSAVYQAPDCDASEIASMVSDSYPPIQSLRLSSPGIPEVSERVNDFGKRAASHELLPAHSQKQIKIDVEEKLHSKRYELSMMSGKKPDNQNSVKSPFKKVFEAENIGNKKKPALVIGGLSSSSNERHGVENVNEQEAKIKQLEARISHLTTLVNSVEGKCNSTQQALQAQEMIETTTAVLQQDLDIASIRIQAQERAIKSILGPENDILEE
ncbi:hypothetical protein DFH28DRAFT_933255 [Melampsora americana]|nr:hypothetical protein DFH28DRAFT_933255 [Melampsora americana]